MLDWEAKADIIIKYQSSIINHDQIFRKCNIPPSPPSSIPPIGVGVPPIRYRGAFRALGPLGPRLVKALGYYAVDHRGPCCDIMLQLRPTVLELWQQPPVSRTWGSRVLSSVTSVQQHSNQCNLASRVPLQRLRDCLGFLRGGFSLREAFHWIPGAILSTLVVSKPSFEDSGPNLTKSDQINPKSVPN